MEEIWKDISGYEGIYQVSNLGRVRSVGRTVTYINNRKHYVNGSILSCVKGSKGYLQVTLCNNGRKNINIHRIVAEAFIPNPDNKIQINHIDGDKTNNTANNLEWCSCSENLKHAFRTGLNHGNKGMSKPQSKGSGNPSARSVYIICPGGTTVSFGSVIEACEYMRCEKSTFFRGIKREDHKCKDFKVYYER